MTEQEKCAVNKRKNGKQKRKHLRSIESKRGRTEGERAVKDVAILIQHMKEIEAHEFNGGSFSSAQA